ncbi:uncharacterized protein M437DRAFT_69781 [Aureobasidium melanogenum CBS 110374]|uniref:Uncharacterized protein n=1 Tax=Aureobasidium melanogenum (strain CBS 110374) TaxID=1043003 RepID=A0A074VLV5_AURM1|nr:uncharacterized protein M437DRAFT_69781 [Aureobasidium melanogenum CBS 110374]KEQ58627.1 hypothetical protein M437DRAFT_69781 [Aureobasidium melanogenum CBS 110374]
MAPMRLWMLVKLQRWKRSHRKSWSSRHVPVQTYKEFKANLSDLQVAAKKNCKGSLHVLDNRLTDVGLSDQQEVHEGGRDNHRRARLWIETRPPKRRVRGARVSSQTNEDLRRIRVTVVRGDEEGSRALRRSMHDAAVQQNQGYIGREFNFSILAAATALVGSATAAPQNNGNWQSYASQASSYWASANPSATGDWSSWANAASSYWNSVSPSAAPSQWSSYASAASSYWASHSGSMITAAPSAFPWAGGFGPGGPGGWRGGNGYGPFGDIANGTNSGWGPWGTGAWTSGPWTSWWGGSNCPDSTWSGWTSGPWGTNAPWTSWSGCKASTTATSTITTTVSGTPTTTVAYGVRVNAASAASSTSGSGSGTAATATHTGAASNMGVSGAGVGIGAAVAAVLML